MKNLILFFTLALFWGGSFLAIKVVIKDIPAFTAAFYRVFFAIIFLSFIYIKSIRLPKNFWTKELVNSILAGLFSIGIPFSLLFWGEQYISASLAGILNGTVPFWTLLIGIALFSSSKKISKKKILGLITGFLGISFIFGPKIQIEGNFFEIYGLIAITMMSMFYGIGTNLNRKILTNHKEIIGPLNLIIQHFAATTYLGILAFLIDGPFNYKLLFKLENGLSIFYLSFISTTLAFIIFFKLIKEVGSVEASTVTFFVPAVALILDMTINSHSLTLLEGIGTLIIFSSMLLLKEVAPKKQS